LSLLARIGGGGGYPTFIKSKKGEFDYFLVFVPIYPLSIYFTARVMKFGNKCEFREYPDMRHGWTVRGDMR
jgi:hypothetical protein